MMTEMFVIQMTHHRAIGDDFPYYYKGQNRSGENCFDYRKNTAKRYSLKEEAGVTSRCMPFEQEQVDEVCVCCGKPAKKMIYWGIAY